MQPFADRYLHADFENGLPNQGRIVYVNLFSIIALFLLAIACINFMNLTTARSAHRAREIGVRKVMGAIRGLLIQQFLGEAILMAVFSAVVALLMVAALLPSFNVLTGKEIDLPFGQSNFWISIIMLVLVTGIFSGSYPAFYLSSFNPVGVLKGARNSITGTSWLRKGLVVFQFVLSIVLIISTILITRQISFVKNARLGYEKGNLIYVPVEGELIKDITVFNNEAKKLPGIAAVSEFTEEPTEMNNGNLGIGWEGKDPRERARFISNLVGPDFAKTMKIEMAEGRDFSKEFLTDSQAVIINQTALMATGYKDPIGKTMLWGNRKLPIVGVMKDFHFRSLHDPIQPLILRPGGKSDFSTILIRTEQGKMQQAISGLALLYKRLNPKFPFSYKFSDQEYARLYKSEEVTWRLSMLFAGLAILISCLGLLGLSMFTAEQRKKEIGIRKILGASVGSLFGLLSREFLVLIGIAFLIAAPLGWWSMHEWLKGYAYHTSIPVWIFILAGGSALAIALLTVCFHSVRAANVNPVLSLRSE
jgi:ABC-type antimicrobial peptide transport system permease subunit